MGFCTGKRCQKTKACQRKVAYYFSKNTHKIFCDNSVWRRLMLRIISNFFFWNLLKCTFFLKIVKMSLKIYQISLSQTKKKSSYATVRNQRLLCGKWWWSNEKIFTPVQTKMRLDSVISILHPSTWLFLHVRSLDRQTDFSLIWRGGALFNLIPKCVFPVRLQVSLILSFQAERLDFCLCLPSFTYQLNSH